MSRPRKPKSNLSLKAITSNDLDVIFECVCDIKQSCLCSPINKDQERAKRTTAGKDQLDKILRRPAVQ